MTKKKKIFIAAGIAALLTFSVFLLLNYMSKKGQENYLEKYYIFDKNFPTGKKISASSVNKYFLNGVVTARALDLFRFLEQKFAVESLHELDDHFNQVERYLNSRFDQSEAKKLNELYQKHLRCQIELVNNPKYGQKVLIRVNFLFYSTPCKISGEKKWGKKMRICFSAAK